MVVVRRLRTKPAGMCWRKWKEYRSCKSKVRYAHMGQVRREASARRMDWYQCEHCGGFHIATPTLHPEGAEGGAP